MRKLNPECWMQYYKQWGNPFDKYSRTDFNQVATRASNFEQMSNKWKSLYSVINQWVMSKICKL